MKRLLIYIICAAAAVTTYAQTLAARADSAYSAEDYRLAIRLYNDAISTECVSPEIYYNLGNAYYRISSIGKAVASYQRALNIDPSFKDARTNLEFVKSRIPDRPEDDSSFLGNLQQSIVSAISPNAWAWVALASFVALIACLALYIFTGNVGLRKVGFFGAGVLLIITIYFIVVAYQASAAYSGSSLAVITVPTSELRSEPGSSSDDHDRVIPLHEGTMVEITDSITLPGESAAPKWYNVKINNSTSAWINAADVEKI